MTSSRWVSGPVLVPHDKLKNEVLDRGLLTNLSPRCGVQPLLPLALPTSARICAPINPRNQTAGGLKHLDGFLWTPSALQSVVQLITEVKETQRRPELQTPQETEPRSRTRIQAQQEVFSSDSGATLQFPAGGGEEALT